MSIGGDSIFPANLTEDELTKIILSMAGAGASNTVEGASASPAASVPFGYATTQPYLGGVPMYPNDGLGGSLGRDPLYVPNANNVGPVEGYNGQPGYTIGGPGAGTLTPGQGAGGGIPFLLAGNGAGMDMGLSGSDQLMQDLMLASQLGGGDPNNPLFGIPFDRQVNPFGSSGLPINETLLAQMIYDNPQFAIGMGGVAKYGTPGYWNLAGMDFDPYSIYAASGGNLLGGPVDYLQFAANMYNTMGTVGSQGGGTVDAGNLLVNMVTAPPDSQLGKMFSENPESFYTMALDVASAAGMSPLGQQALKMQLAGLYQEYMEVALTSNAGDIPAFHTWIGTSHPEIVAAWRS